MILCDQVWSSHGSLHVRILIRVPNDKSHNGYLIDWFHFTIVKMPLFHSTSTSYLTAMWTFDFGARSSRFTFLGIRHFLFRFSRMRSSRFTFPSIRTSRFAFQWTGFTSICIGYFLPSFSRTMFAFT